MPRSNGPKGAFFATQAVAKPPLISIGGVKGETHIMTLRPGSDLVRFPRYVCEYEDGARTYSRAPTQRLSKGRSWQCCVWLPTSGRHMDF
jgi:hypothetical protein